MGKTENNLEIKILFDKKKRKITAWEKNNQVAYLNYLFPPDWAKERNLEIKYLYVKPKFRRKGIATKLVEALLKEFNQITWISFWTGRQAEIDKGYLLYEKLGFKTLAYLPDYYEKGIGTRFVAKRIN